MSTGALRGELSTKKIMDKQSKKAVNLSQSETLSQKTNETLFTLVLQDSMI